MSSTDLRRIPVIDLEATCYPHNEFPEGEKQQIIAVGVAFLVRDRDAGDYSAERGGVIYVNPQVPVSPFCVELTGLTDEKLQAEGLTFTGMVAELRRLIPHLERYPWASWGDFDRDLFQAEAHRHLSEAGAEELDDYDARRKRGTLAGLPRTVYPFGKTHFNAKALCALAMRRKEAKGFSVETAMEAMEMKFQGTPHQAEDDAFNTARLLAHPFSMMNYA
jgi:inhibitor of KinA sporulation pathway (predicted exonuclease)